MGGQQHGELAAELAISALRHFVVASSDRHDVSWPFGYSFDFSLDANRITNAIRLANRHVWLKATEDLEKVGMGTTVTALLVSEGRSIIGNVGDTRAYLSNKDGFRQVSIDDTMIARMVATGAISAAEAATHPMRNVLTQAVGSREVLDVHIWEDSFSSGDAILLCSDGMYGVVGPLALETALASTRDPPQILEDLISQSLAGGATDNVSAILIYG